MYNLLPESYVTPLGTLSYVRYSKKNLNIICRLHAKCV